MVPAHYPTHTRDIFLTKPINLQTCAFLECGKKLEHLEKSHAVIERTYKLCSQHPWCCKATLQLWSVPFCYLAFFLDFTLVILVIKQEEAICVSLLAPRGVILLVPFSLSLVSCTISYLFIFALQLPFDLLCLLTNGELCCFTKLQTGTSRWNPGGHRDDYTNLNPPPPLLMQMSFTTDMFKTCSQH